MILERVILALVMLIRYWRNARWQLSPNGRRAREVDDALIADLQRPRLDRGGGEWILANCLVTPLAFPFPQKRE